MHLLKLLTALAAIGVPLTIFAQAAPGDCGEYMYWKDGKCVDARDRAPEAWTEQMAKKKATW
jgi:hypothetical protein